MCFLQKGSAVIQADVGFDADIEWDRREYIVAEFIDEEGTVADLRVDQGFKVFLRPGSTYVIHRAKLVEHAGTVDASAMFAFLPCGYKWTAT